MRSWFALAWFALSMLGTGCALVHDAARNVVLSIETPIEAHREKARDRRWAEAAWMNVAMKGEAHYSVDYAKGFKYGFAEYLYRGGEGELVLVPPNHYRNIRYQTPEGYAAIQDWFNGYRQGSIAARDSGARNCITGPPAFSAAASGSIPAPPPAVQERPPEPRPIPLAVQRVVPERLAPPVPSTIAGASANFVPSEPSEPIKPSAAPNLDAEDIPRARIIGSRVAPLSLKERLIRAATPN
jgi:hypothetical protein